MRRIRTEKDLKQGVSALVGSCAHMARVHALSGDPPLRRRPMGFEGLSRVIVGQQLSVASANAIWARLEVRVQPFSAASLLAVPEAEMRAAGLSAVKTATLRRLAEAIGSGDLDLDALSDAPETAIHERLTEIKGIGPWTADIYILFCLGRPDAWSPGDLGLKLAASSTSDGNRVASIPSTGLRAGGALPSRCGVLPRRFACGTLDRVCGDAGAEQTIPS